MTTPSGSEVVIKVAGVDVSHDVIYSTAVFEAQMAAVPGLFSFSVRDRDMIYDFLPGAEVTLDIDGTRSYGGWALQPTAAYAFPAADTSDLSAVKGRIWKLAGPDFNYLLDKRVLRRTDHPTSLIPTLIGSITDDAVIRTHFPTYFDIPAGFDFTDASRILTTHTYSGTGYDRYTFPTLGTKMRDVLNDLAEWGGVFYIDASKRLNYVPVQNTLAPWGFSDVPNGITTIGFRDGDLTDDITSIANDVFVFGGSEWAGDGDVVVARRQNTDSMDLYGRWQLVENDLGNPKYKIQAQVDARANTLINGADGTSYVLGSLGLVHPEKQFRATWHGHKVPIIGGVHRHLQPGEAVTVELQTFDITVTVPMRQVRITFPTLDGRDSPSTAYVKFEGFFGLMMSDPYWLWAYLKKAPNRQHFVVTANDSSVNPPHGARYQGVPTPAPDGVTTNFFIPFPYVADSYSLFADERLKRKGSYWTESDPAAGKITISPAPAGGTSLYSEAVLSGG